ncbi:hypothetical protein BS47DRAFT_893667 [Hydnum rufescens UP504]|uniref:DRBM domain-containing protein n=1 Tax=Hydnum rufescens UP504 TaxID=1448309 RepID=A0A9P6DTG1_9AGAM|nr:hypothetical protein BS47DRAFT_893667 [Hydnum rufescens UP504]
MIPSVHGKRLVWRVRACVSHQISTRLTCHSTPRKYFHEYVGGRSPNSISINWRATAVVDGQPIESGSGPRLKVAKDRAAKEALIALGQIEESD